MTRFVSLPNLPVNAAHVILGEPYRPLLDYPLRKLGISPLYVPENPLVDCRLRGHADLSIVHIGGAQLVLAPFLRNSQFAAALSALGCELRYAEIAQGREYPQDAQLNICVWGNFWLGSPKTAASELRQICASREKATWISVKQGYARCACCLVDSLSMISADKGIAKALSAYDTEVLEILPGSIALPGFPYGFLGGSACKLSEHVLAFTGHLDAHPDKSAILDFLAAREIEAIYLTDMPAFDIGGAIPLTERS